MDLPEGIVTFLFSDVEGSTGLLERHPDEVGAALARHHELFERLVAAHRGTIFETVGDAVYAAFADPTDAAAAGLAIQRALAAQDWTPIPRLACRLAIHTGEVERRGDHYFGPALFRCARLQAIGYGEQTLLSARAAEAVRPRLPEGTSLRDLGRHRLRDLSEPEQVFMLVHPDLREAFPPPRSVDLRPNNLPVQLSSFVGREREIDELSSLVREHRLVTLTGPGGVGKTRLAIQVAGLMIEKEPDGAFFVDLAPVREADQLVPAAAATLGLSPGPGTSVGEALKGFLGSRQMLLVLDNTEQIRTAGREVLPLIERAPGLRVIVTARVPLRVRGEYVYPLDPLPLDGPDPFDSPAVRLFADRAAERGRFAMSERNVRFVAEICARLDGLPLAIELAAARTTVFEPSELLERLAHRLTLLTGGAEDLPERQRTLRSAIAWSHDLLAADARRTFARLAIFRGGWSLEAAEAVCDADADLLATLTGAALVRRVGSRFGMLETIREFAEERLAQLPEAEETARRYATWCRDWAEQATDAATNPVAVLGALSVEVDNLAQAMEFFIGRGDGDGARRLARHTWILWLSRGQMQRGERWMARALELPPPPDQTAAISLTAILGEFPRFGGEPMRAIAIKEEALRLAETAGDLDRTAAVLHDLGSLWADVGDLGRARRLVRKGLALRRRLGDPRGVAHALEGAGDVELRAGDHQAARDLYRECAAVANGDEWSVVVALLGIAESSRRLGDIVQATEALTEAVRRSMGWNIAIITVESLEWAAALLVDRDRRVGAATLLAALEARSGMSGVAILDHRVHEETTQIVREALDPVVLDAAWERGRAMSSEEALGYAYEELTGQDLHASR